MRYVLRTRGAGLLLKPSQKWNGSNEHQFRIRGKSNLDYAKDTHTRCSVSGYVVYLEDAPKMQRSATQKTVAFSSCKAEFAAVICVQDMMYQRNMLESIELKLKLPMILEMDNKRAVNLVNSFIVGGHTGHINIKQCFLQVLEYRPNCVCPDKHTGSIQIGFIKMIIL
jgi:hypothetical protein